MSKTKSAAKVTAHGTARVTPAEALEMLASAVNYCQQAGLVVRSGNVPNLVLSVDGALLEDGRFIVGPVVTALAEVTAPEPLS